MSNRTSKGLPPEMRAVPVQVPTRASPSPVASVAAEVSAAGVSGVVCPGSRSSSRVRANTIAATARTTAAPAPASARTWVAIQPRPSLVSRAIGSGVAGARWADARSAGAGSPGAGLCAGVASATTFSKIAPSGARMNSTGVAHSSRNSASRALRALVTAWSTGSPSASDP